MDALCSNLRLYAKVIEKAAILIASTNTPARYKETWRNILNKYKQRIILDAGKLREKHPNCIP
ncbi:PREDICTED: LOC109948429, partial [Prunus dulcis]